jgi:NhaP-type Na+/H+ or K+/H+ antiporter
MSEGDSQHEKTLNRVMVYGTAMAFGMLGAVMASMKDFLHGNATFTFSLRTVVAFVAGFLLGWLFWWVIRRFKQPDRPE